MCHYSCHAGEPSVNARDLSLPYSRLCPLLFDLLCPLLFALFILASLAAAGCGGSSSGGQNSPAQVDGGNRPAAETKPQGNNRSPHRSEGQVFTFDLPLNELTPRMDAILSTVSGVVGPGRLGHVHSIQDDEDLHFDLENSPLQTPVVCELMNALSIPRAAVGSPAYWRNRFAGAFHSPSRITAQGVFRLWPDHASSGGAEEAEDRPTSNPPHVVELHPLSSFAADGVSFDTRSSIAPITQDGEQFAYKDPGRWGDMLSQTIRAHVIERGGRSFLELKTPQIGFNYWKLRAQVITGVRAARDGHRFTVRIVTPTRTYREPVRCFTVVGSGADGSAARVQAGSEITLLAIGRMDLRTLLQPGGYEGPMPVELCVFGINPRNLPSTSRGARRPREEPGGGELAAAGMTPSLPGNPATLPAGYPFIGNRRSHIYHSAEGHNLPSPPNRVFFRTAQEAEGAGYRASRT